MIGGEVVGGPRGAYPWGVALQVLSVGDVVVCGVLFEGVDDP